MTDKTQPFMLIHIKGWHPLEKSLGFVKKIQEMPVSADSPTWIASPFPFIQSLKKEFTEASVGSDQMLSTADGTFTAPIAAKMLNEAGAKFTLIGSVSERKTFPNDEKNYSKKIAEAINHQVTPVLCIGESTLDEEQSHKENLAIQLRAATADLSSDQLNGLHIVYDAVWINQAPWQINNPKLTEAYKAFHESIEETFEKETVENFNLIYPIPSHSADLEIILSKYATNVAGYFLGIASDIAEC